MYPTQPLFSNFMPLASTFPHNRANTNLNHLAPHQLTNSIFQIPFNLGLPVAAPMVMPNPSNILSMLKLRDQLIAQKAALYSANISKLNDTTSYSPILKPKITPYSPSIKETLDGESPLKKFKLDLQPKIKTSLSLPDDPDICFEAQIKYMIQLFVNSFGLVSNQEIRQAKQKYSQNALLLQVFEALEAKYTTTAKTREEMVKWILRRCLKITKASIKKAQKKGQKQALKDLCTRYFEFDTNGNDGEEEDDSEIVDKVLPFRKNSKNRTMNSSFVAEIFQSEEFKSDYKKFLKGIDEIIDKENSEKASKFTAFIIRCAKKQDFSPISKYKRIPWLKVWLENTKKVTEELDQGNYDGKAAKKAKIT